MRVERLKVLLVSQAPLEKLQGYKRRMGWQIPWVSSSPGDFNFDLGFSQTEEQSREAVAQIRLPGQSVDAFPPVVEHNARSSGTDIAGYLTESPGFSTFVRDGDDVYHAYSTTWRGLEFLMGYYPILDRAPKGATRVTRGSSGSAGTTSTGASDDGEEERTMMLRDKVAVIYGAGGEIGGAVAPAFAHEGAKVFLTGHDLMPVEAVTKEIDAFGGSAEAAEVDALDEQAVDEHLRSVIEKAGRVDISFNAVGIPDAETLGVPMVDLDVERFTLPIVAYTRTYFLTARLAARRMMANGSGVIMTVTSLLSRTGAPLVGGYGPAQAAKEALTRDLSAEFAPRGIRVVGLRPQAMPETGTIKEAFEPRAEASGMTWDQWQEMLASRTHPRRLMTLEEMANAAVFVASDKASGMTGTTVNLTMGSLDD